MNNENSKIITISNVNNVSQFNVQSTPVEKDINIKSILKNKSNKQLKSVQFTNETYDPKESRD